MIMRSDHDDGCFKDGDAERNAEAMQRVADLLHPVILMITDVLEHEFSCCDACSTSMVAQTMVQIGVSVMVKLAAGGDPKVNASAANERVHHLLEEICREYAAKRGVA